MKTRMELIKKSVGIKFHDMGGLSGSFDMEISESVSLKVKHSEQFECYS